MQAKITAFSRSIHDDDAGAQYGQEWLSALVIQLHRTRDRVSTCFHDTQTLSI
ncbi:hypothetical protein OG738_11410 [Amycolatopsis sp. NBC_01488]|uniref:hypothetical protein n=1 Tax=Amycolatopsis sp. NBC_01488 TaxID=2903563 RepID=UPI002E2E75DB|nr:hypothetical protein [Amycolatopsis sp. NBC_01488]